MNSSPPSFKGRFLGIAVACLTTLCFPPLCRGWDYEGHRVVNQLALSALPTNFPAFVQTPEARERIAFLSGEVDRWRNSPERLLRHVNGPDHYFDLEDLEPLDLKPEQLSMFRYEFVAQMTKARVAHPERFPAIDPTKDGDRTRGLPGFLPWALAEHHAKLKSAFSYLKVYEAHGTAVEVANARANVVYLMGVMGHFAGDASQPLHSTRHFNGWTGENPQGYTTMTRFHSWIDGGYLAKTGGVKLEALQPRLRSAVQAGGVAMTNVFMRSVEFIQEQHKLVEPLYKLEKEGKLSGEGAAGMGGRQTMEEQLVKASQFLSALWHSAWRDAHPDGFLQSQLEQRKLKATNKAKSP